MAPLFTGFGVKWPQIADLLLDGFTRGIFGGFFFGF